MIKSLRKTFVLLTATTMLFTSSINAYAYTNYSNTPISFTTSTEIELGDVEVLDFTLDFTGESQWEFDGVEYSGGSAVGDSGDWSWDNTTKTLTLNNFAFATTADVAMIVPKSTNIILKAQSNNMIVTTSDSQSNDSYGIYSPEGDLTITGQGLNSAQGHLSVASGSVDNHYDVSTAGICVEKGDLTFDNASVVVKAGEIINIKSSSDTTAFSTGIGVYKDDINSKYNSGANAQLTVKNDSYVEIITGDGDKDAGLRLIDTDVSIKDSYFITEGNAFGMYSLGNTSTTININDSYFEAIAKGYDGMYLQNVSNFTVNGSKIIAKGGSQSDSCGINIIDANLNLNDTTIEAIGTMYGISSLKNPKTENLDNRYIKINGGVATLKGGTVAFNTDVEDAKTTITEANIYIKDDQNLYTKSVELDDKPKDIKIYKRSEEYEIRFDLNYENAPTAQTQKTEDKVIEDLYKYEPNRTGYVFDGWYLKSDNSTVTATTEFEKDTTIYARWSMKALEVTFDSMGGTVGTNEKVQSTQADGKLMMLPDAAKANSELIGWFLKKEAPTDGSADVQVDINTVFDKDTTVYARWQNLYLITFNPTEGAVLKETDSTNVDGTMNEFPIPKRENHAFAGWFTSRSGGTQITTDTEFNSNTTVYAQWIKDEFTIILDPNFTDGYLSSVPTENHTLESIPELIRDDYEMVTLYDSAVGGKEITTETVFEENTTIYATWTEARTPLNYSITFDSQGATMGTVIIDTNASNIIEDYPIPQKEGYAFEGWYTSADGGSKVATSNVYSDNTTIYAKWDGDGTVVQSQTTTDSVQTEVSNQIITSYDIPTMEGLYIEEFQNVVVGDYVEGLRNVDPLRSDLGTFVGWYHGASLTTPVSYTDLTKMTVTSEILQNGIYPMFEVKKINVVETDVPDTGMFALNKLF